MIFLRRSALIALFGIPNAALYIFAVVIVAPAMTVMTLLFEGTFDPKGELAWSLEIPMEMTKSLWDIKA